jgi:endonuclease III related protein
MTKGAGLEGIGYTSRMRRKSSESRTIRRIFRILEAAMGPQHWWPAGSAFEVVVGAYLTQNTAWTNVELAMGNLRGAGVLSIPGIRRAALEELERLVRPAGYYRQKAARLKRFVAHLDASYGGSLETMFARPVEALREELLGLAGIGPETADSILLYAASREVFVVDAYTRRIFERHGLARTATGYEEIRAGVETALGGCDAEDEPAPEAARWDALTEVARPEVPRPEEPPAAAHSPAAHAPSAASAMARSELSQRYNEFHALLVQTAKHYCLKAAPRCRNCPLRPLLPPGAQPR